MKVNKSTRQSVSYQEGLCPVDYGQLWYRYYETESSKTDPITLIILHGGPGCPSDYLFELASLNRHFNVLFYDQLGCGRSTQNVTSDALNVEQFSRDLQQLIEHLDFDRFVLLGQSFGGFLALHHQKNQASKAEKLILASPLVCTKDWQRDAQLLISQLKPADQDALSQSTDSAAYQQAEARFYQRYFCKLEPWPTLLTYTMNNLSTEVYETMWGPNEFTSTGNLRNADCTDVLAQLSCPVLFICGSEDEARPSTLQKYVNLCKEGYLEVLIGGTHSVHLEQPLEFMDKVTKFIKQS